MTKYILHIGRHKTGTTFLQHFLFNNRKALMKHGYYYPATGLSRIAHHIIARNFSRKILNVGTEEEVALLRGKTKALFEEIAGIKETILLSSEAFQNSDPRLIAKRFDPERTKVIVYIREQLEYLVSSYQQCVHATSYCASLEESVERHIADYDSFLRKWEDAFGKENIVVRVYDRRHLLRNDIVHDFMNCLGVDIADGLSLPSGDRNPSIGGVLLEFKRLINAIGINDETQLKMFWKSFSAISAGNASYRAKPLLSASKANSIRKIVRESNDKIFARHFDGADVFAHPAPSQHEGRSEVSTADLWQVLADIRRSDPKTGEHIIDILSSAGNSAPQPAARHGTLSATTRERTPAARSPGMPNRLSDNDLMRVLQDALEIQQCSGRRLVWNRFPAPLAPP